MSERGPGHAAIPSAPNLVVIVEREVPERPCGGLLPELRLGLEQVDERRDPAGLGDENAQVVLESQLRNGGGRCFLGGGERTARDAFSPYCSASPS